MRRLRRALLAPYHYALARLAALRYGFPSRRMTVIGVTGTKGKSSVAEMLYAILSAAGYETALAGTIRFALGKESRPNLFKMTLPGRGFIQKFLAEALAKGCTHAVVELTSEAALQYRHLGVELDALIVTNIQREHIESHGSFEKYVAAKRALVAALERSPKRLRVLVANEDIPESRAFLSADVSRAIGFSARELEGVVSDDCGARFDYAGTPVSLPLPGIFNAMNALAAIKAAEALGVSRDAAATALAELAPVKGRVERIETGQDFLAVVDYAHTPDSLKALYGAFPNRRKICVLGNTGGGRDVWKRPEMGRIAEEACETVILTDEDPYDEDPRAIIDAMAAGMSPGGRRSKLQIILDRRSAIRAALRLALSLSKGAPPQPLDSARGAGNQDIAVLISGKGTDPFIMGARGTRTPWSDAAVVREELERLGFKR